RSPKRRVTWSSVSFAHESHRSPIPFAKAVPFTRFDSVNNFRQRGRWELIGQIFHFTNIGVNAFVLGQLPVNRLEWTDIQVEWNSFRNAELKFEVIDCI